MKFGELLKQTRRFFGFVTLAFASTTTLAADKHTTPHDGTLRADSMYMARVSEEAAEKQQSQNMRNDLARQAAVKK